MDRKAIALFQNTIRNSHQRCSVRKGVLGNVTKCTGEHLCQSIFFNNVAGLRRFPLNFKKFLRTPFSQNISWGLLLFYVKPILKPILKEKQSSSAFNEWVARNTTNTFWLFSFKGKLMQIWKFAKIFPFIWK